MKPFLQRIADEYCHHEAKSMADFCFVFPNKRSATFFRYYLGEHVAKGSRFLEPEVTTISDFISEFSDNVVASRYDLLFMLYNIYSKLSTKDNEEFDKFVFWGDMLLSDFNDVDRYMCDAHQLLRNVKNFKEISTDYLTVEQKKIIQKYWGIELLTPDETDSADRFWNHLKEGKGSDSFTCLWEILEPLYTKFREALSKRQLCYSGMQYREVAERFSDMTAEEFPYRRIIMVGFNVLSISELSIFARLNDLGIADFYWDYSFPKELTNNMATHFIKKYVKEFKSRYDITKDTTPELPEIDVIGIPSNVGQVKYAGKLIDDMVADGRITNPQNAINTAIVLPTEDLFIELLHSIPKSITDFNTAKTPSVNITMGYPMKLTPAAALMRSVMNMHLKAKKIRNNWCFFYEDICDVLANPLISRIAPAVCENIRNEIESKRLFNVPAVTLRDEWGTELKDIFYPVDNLRSGKAVFDYTLSLISFLEQELTKLHEQNTVEDTVTETDEDSDTAITDDASLPTDDDELPQPIAIELGFLSKYRRSVEQLRDIAMQNGITMRDSTFFHLIRSVVDAETINFTGEPLKGLQIMGILETRALNFDNLIIMSMNERIFPKRRFTRSFIPNTLRRCFGMATMEFQECIFSYYFYRMVAAAKNVTLLYDTRTEALNSGDMSRYIYQLRHNYPSDRFHLHNAAFELPGTDEQPTIVSIAKDDEMMAKINAYKSTAEDKKYLSPSAINTFLNCPLQFCLRYLKGLNDENEITEYMDESTFGTVFHQVMEYTYTHLRGDRDYVLIKNEDLKNLQNNDIKLSKLITSAINQHYNRLPNENNVTKLPKSDKYEYINTTPLTGEAKIIGEIILERIKLMLKLEQKRTPFKFIDAEKYFTVSIPLSPSGLAINLHGIIDRIDIGSTPKDGSDKRESSDENDYNWKLEIIDYKTGSDNIAAKSIDNLFPQPDDKQSAQKAILQLYLYCNAYNISAKNDQPVSIKPYLYRFRNPSNIDGTMPSISIGGISIEDYLDFNDEVLEMLEKRLAPLFDKETPFMPTPNERHCKFCNFKVICGG